MAPTGIEHYTVDGLGNTAAGDTLDYTGTTSAVTVNLGARALERRVLSWHPSIRLDAAGVGR